MKAPSNSPGGEELQAQPSLGEDSNTNAASSPSKGCAADGLPSSKGENGMGRCDYYVNEEGLVVFTAKYLLERGYCCGNGCKHCPYGYEAVPEPKRSALLAKDKHEF